MKTYLYLLILIISTQLSYSQVGIGTKTPSATLDLVSKGNSSSTYSLKVKNNENQDLMSVGDNGNLFFKRSLIAGSSAGANNFVLASKGANNLPVWENISNSPLHKYITVAYHAQNTSDVGGQAGSSNILINFGNLPTVNSTVIGGWNPSTRVYTVLENGIYDITATIPAIANQSSPNRKAVMSIHLGNYTQSYKGTNHQGSDFVMMCTGKVTRYLTAGTQISVTVRVTGLSGQNSWHYQNAILNINYSPKTS